jgi:hypothetical protein
MLSPSIKVPQVMLQFTGLSMTQMDLVTLPSECWLIEFVGRSGLFKVA